MVRVRDIVLLSKVLLWAAVFAVGVQAVCAQGLNRQEIDVQVSGAESEAMSEAERASLECRILQASLKAPYYFCDCHEGASTFAFPLIDQIADTVWYTASVDDVRKGMTAYWFADCSVTLKVYAKCSSKTPTISLTVGKDQMYEMDAADINKKLDEMGEAAGTVISALTPHIRVYPNGKCSGKVYVFPYNEGPHSTCDATLPVRTSMTYVSNHSDDVYEWEPERLPSSGAVYVQWKEQKNNPCEVWVTRGSCSGTEVARTTLADSTKLFFPERQLIQSAREAGESLFFHFAHSADQVGRIRFCTEPHYVPRTIDTIICQGMGLQLADTLLTQTTRYANDTVWHRGDTVYINTYHLTITAPAPQRDTLRVKSKDVPMLYRDREYIDAFGDYDLTLHTPDACDERYLLSVEHLITRTSVHIDTTICQGKTLTIDGQTYTQDTLVATTEQIDADTYADRYIRVQFTAPEVEYDTLYLTPDEIREGYYYADANTYIDDYGDYSYTVSAKNRCTRTICLHVQAEPLHTSLNEVVTPAHRTTLLRTPQGTLYILHGGIRYSLLGQPIEPEPPYRQPPTDEDGTTTITEK